MIRRLHRTAPCRTGRPAPSGDTRRFLACGVAAVAVLPLALVPTSSSALCVICTCTASTTPMAFGAYDATSSLPLDATATVTVNCYSVASVLSTADIAISAGGSGTASARRMTGPGTLNYNLYTSPLYTTVWGDGTGGSSAVQIPINGLLNFSVSATAYGRIPPKQNVAVGSYADSVTITVTY